MAGDIFLPDWLEQGVESSLRDSEDETPPVPLSLSSAQGSVPRSIASSSRASPVVLTPSGPSPAGSYSRPESGKAPWTDLDAFYADTNEREQEESEEETDEDEEESDDTQEAKNEDEDAVVVSDEDESGSEDEEDSDEHENQSIIHAAR
jgi:AP-3 complex subunit beta